MKKSMSYRLVAFILCASFMLASCSGAIDDPTVGTSNGVTDGQVQETTGGKPTEPTGGTDVLETQPPAGGTDVLETQPPVGGTDVLETQPPAGGTDVLETQPPAGGSDVLETQPPSDEDSPYPIDQLKINGIDIEEYVISCDTSAGGVISYAASELQRYIAVTTGVTIPIETTPVNKGIKRIAIDDTIIADANNFRIFSDADGIVLAGSAKRSALYAVYHFLEECIGWTFFTSDTETCNEEETINLENIYIDFEHSFAIRDIYWTEYFDEDISVKRYQNGTGKRRKLFNENPTSVALGGSDTFHPYGIHTFGALTGLDSSNQPCLNNEDIYQRMLNSVVEWLSEDSTRKMIHVSQNDNRRYCTCAECSADLQIYGSPAGSIIKLVNRMDEDLKARGFLDITIVTFAYQYSFPCPQNITCNKDIAVELCTIDYCFNHAFDDPNCEKNAACMAQIKAWSGICDSFYIWDYTINFKYYLCPFPNFDVLLENLKVMNAIGAQGILEQGNFQTVSGEFGALRCYLLAKVLENPNMTNEEYESHMNAFLEAYYGPGWECIRRFIDFVTELSNQKDTCFGIYSSPEDIYGNHAFSSYSDWLKQLWDTAEDMAATELQLEHVQRSRLCCDYLRIGSIFQETKESADPAAIQVLRTEIQQLHEDCKRLGVTRIAENCPLPETVDYDQNPRAWWDLHQYVE